MLAEPVTGEFIKQPAERFIVAIDWTARLAPAETIAAATYTASDASTGQPADVVDGLTVVGSIVRVFVARGQAGRRYKITVRVETSAGAIHEADLFMDCRDY